MSVPMLLATIPDIDWLGYRVRGAATRLTVDLDSGAARLDPKKVTEYLRSIRAGEEDAAEPLFELVYEDLRLVAGGLFSSERQGHTLQPTALVNEAWLKLAPHLDQIEDRIHFFAVSSRAMRQILTDHARRVHRQKRGAGRGRVTLDDHLGWEKPQGIDLVDLSDTLDRLASLNQRHARIVELRFLGGLTIPETATVLGVSEGTIENDWFMARSWLRTQLSRP